MNPHVNLYTVGFDRIYIAQGVGELFTWLRAGATLIEIVHGDYLPRFRREPDPVPVWYPEVVA